MASLSMGSRDPICFKQRLQRRRHLNCAVRLLPGLNQGDEKAGQSGATAVENMRMKILPIASFEAQIHAASLKILAVRTTRNFQVLPLPWRPHLDVKSFG